MKFLRRLFGQAIETDSFYLPDGTDNAIGLIASPDSSRYAYAVRDWRGAHVEVNGKRLRTYDAVSGITFSPDAQRLAYAAMRRHKWFVLCDELEYEPWDDIGKTSPILSPDSKHIAYTARRASEWFVVVDGRTVGGPYEGFSPGGIVFSPDSQRRVCVIKKGVLWVAVISGKEHEAFPTIMTRSWSFSPNSEKVAYVAGVSGKRKGDAFVGEASVVINGEIQQLWNHDETSKRDGLSHEVCFSPDSKRVVYTVTQDGKSFFVIDGDPQRAYDGCVSGWANNPLSSKFPEYEKALWRSDAIVFSADSQHYAYAVAAEGQHLLIYDGQERGRHQAILNSPPVFSHDSKRLVYGAEKGSKQFMVVDWTAMEPYDGLPPIAAAFSVDSEHIAYVAVSGADYLLVVDSRSWLLKGGPVIGAKLLWDGPGHLHTLVGEGRNVRIARFEIS